MLSSSNPRNLPSHKQGMTVNIKQELNKWERKQDSINIERVAFTPLIKMQTEMHIVISDDAGNYLGHKEKMQTANMITAQTMIDTLEEMKEELLDDVTPDFVQEGSLKPI